MADVNVKRVGTGMPERRLAVSLHGKPRLRSLSRQNDHSRRKMFTRRHRGTESRKRAIRSGEVMTGGRCRENLRLRVNRRSGRREQIDHSTGSFKNPAGLVASAPGFLCHRFDERGGAHADERAPKASAARRAEAQRTGSERRPGWPT